ncbi:transglycosylase SLT domain-containing protein [Streptomyces sp. TLI_146]|uniref:transglycosylase SLT domain-containing protein n=1 Tax=Streptomyces sp. TLI_146 TaxID=1938858 RepID=UPI000C706378|nr:LysM peptidoglycan-binding domain-containing protein [Streptomyces sp. TLI_146]PKV89331.1 transglycosylase-like protein with SLT domain [Streptomyces sp. TLI_146]
MPAKGKHRRPKSSSLTRGIAAAGTGGAALIIPVIGATSAGAAPSTAHSGAPAKAVSAVTNGTVAAKAIVAKKATATTYSVVAGDSLSKIAQDLDVTGGWKKLYQDNRQAIGADPALIHPGLELAVGKKAKAPAASADRTATSARADRSARTATLPQQATAAVAKTATYANNLDGWIRQSLDIMAQHGIPGSYDGIYRNVMRESSGNPFAINNWDSNAVAGTPSKGLLQVIDPTFQAFHVPGTSTDSYDPVANIVAACNYAAKTYGSIDNVNGAY